MPKTVRLSKKEANDLYRKCVELNKVLITKNRMPVKESELVHVIFSKTINHMRVDQEGNIYVDV